MSVLSVPAEAADSVTDLAAKHGLSCTRLGMVGAVGSTWRLSAGSRTIDVPIEKLRRAFDEALPRRMENEAGLSS